uniref:Uncharacterized protein n=1 Tax=Anguilla anguilla TaxID=7936 RepID=A0A0E9PXL0_ANGAN
MVHFVEGVLQRLWRLQPTGGRCCPPRLESWK